MISNFIALLFWRPVQGWTESGRFVSFRVRIRWSHRLSSRVASRHRIGSSTTGNIQLLHFTLPPLLLPHLHNPTNQPTDRYKERSDSRCNVTIVESRMLSKGWKRRWRTLKGGKERGRTIVWITAAQDDENNKRVIMRFVFCSIVPSHILGHCGVLFDANGDTVCLLLDLHFRESHVH